MPIKSKSHDPTQTSHKPVSTFRVPLRGPGMTEIVFLDLAPEAGREGGISGPVSCKTSGKALDIARVARNIHGGNSIQKITT